MSDKRWFYRDSLEAAYMAKHYGMRYSSGIIELPNSYLVPHDSMFHPKLSDDETTLVNEKALHDAICLTCHEDGDRYYLHPESLHLLKPQIGDLALCEIDDMNHPEAEFQMVTYDPKLFDARHGVCRILMRNGQSFFWPESDPA